MKRSIFITAAISALVALSEPQPLFPNAGLLRSDGQGNVTADTTNYVPTTRTINGKQLTEDITVQGMTDNAVVLTNDTLDTSIGGQSSDITSAIKSALSGEYVTSKSLYDQSLGYGNYCRWVADTSASRLELGYFNSFGESQDDYVPQIWYIDVPYGRFHNDFSPDWSWLTIGPEYSPITLQDALDSKLEGTMMTVNSASSPDANVCSITTFNVVTNGTSSVTNSYTLALPRENCTIASCSDVTDKVNQYKDLSYDPGLEVTWSNVVVNGHIYYVAVTNSDVSVAQ